jgi:hypothetical protein
MRTSRARRQARHGGDVHQRIGRGKTPRGRERLLLL